MYNTDYQKQWRVISQLIACKLLTFIKNNNDPRIESWQTLHFICAHEVS